MSEMPEWLKSTAGFDLETTGKNPMNDEMVTAAVVRLDIHDKEQASVQKQEWAIKPNRLISDEASAITGITNEAIQAVGMEKVEGVKRVYHSLLGAAVREERTLVAFNISYDLTMLREDVLRIGLPWAVELEKKVMDPYVLHKMYNPRFKSQTKKKETLESLCEHYGVQNDGSHDATNDVMSTLRLLWKLAAFNPDLRKDSFEELYAQQVDNYRETTTSLRGWMEKQSWYTPDPESPWNHVWPIQPTRDGAPIPTVAGEVILRMLDEEAQTTEQFASEIEEALRQEGMHNGE